MKHERPIYETEIFHQSGGVAHDLASKQLSMAPNSDIQQALFEHISDGVPLSVAARGNGIPVTNARRAYVSWLQSPPDSQTTSPLYIQFSMRSSGRPRHFTVRQENSITEAALQFSRMNTPLTKVGLRHLAGHVMSSLHTSRIINLPSNRWVEGFLSRNPEIAVRPVRAVDARRIEAVTRHNIATHIARVQVDMDRFDIHDPNLILNVDESGISFQKMAGRSLLRELGNAHEKTLVSTMIRTRGRMERATVMCFVNAAGLSFKPVMVFPGKQPHYRMVGSSVETVHSYLPSCYFYQRENAGVDTGVLLDWVRGFVEETAHLRHRGKNDVAL